MEHPTLRKKVPEWEGINYTGNVLGPPGHPTCGKFSDMCVKAMPNSEDETRRMVGDEIQRKLEPFKEMHPQSTFKHMCKLVHCQVSYKLLVFFD